MIYILDAGNTSIKVAAFKNDILQDVKRLLFNDLLELNDFVLNSTDVVYCSSVLSNEKEDLLVNKFFRCKFFNHDSKLPIIINYLTPKTLGKDRICNAVGAHSSFPSKNVLSIDIGTCIKFDLIDEKGVYQGGAISPGIRLRYQSLNQFTDNLPLLDDKSDANLLGKSTNEAIHSGVMNGIKCEINEIINRYQLDFDDLIVIITGGDSKCFDFKGKNNTFVDENLTIKGLFNIYKLNADN